MCWGLPVIRVPSLETMGEARTWETTHGRLRTVTICVVPGTGVAEPSVESSEWGPSTSMSVALSVTVWGVTRTVLR